MKNVLVFAGTKNGRQLIEAIKDLDIVLFTSSVSQYGSDLLPSKKNIIKSVGNKDAVDIKAFIKLNNIDIVIDSTHPYAKEASINIMEASKSSNISYIRYERQGYIDEEVGIHVKDLDQALNYLSETSGNVLFTTGINGVLTIMEHIEHARIVLRMAPIKASLEKLEKSGLSGKQSIIKMPPYSLEENLDHIKEYNIKYLVTKDSGYEGNTLEKVQACQKASVTLIVIDRPLLEYNEIMYGEDEVLQYLTYL